MKGSGRDGYVQAQAKSHRPSVKGAAFPASLKAVTTRNPTPKEIKDRLQPWQLESICRDWFPDGKRRGKWWVTRCPWREDRKPSLGVSLTTGNWMDFVTKEGGDILDLSMRLYGDSFAQTVRSFAKMLGMV